MPNRTNQTALWNNPTFVLAVILALLEKTTKAIAAPITTTPTTSTATLTTTNMPTTTDYYIAPPEVVGGIVGGVVGGGALFVFIGLFLPPYLSYLKNQRTHLSNTPFHIHEEIELEETETAALNLPKQFRCAISQNLMKDPVGLADVNGKNEQNRYERRILEAFLQKNDMISPETGLAVKEIIPDLALKQGIDEYQQQQQRIQETSVTTPLINNRTSPANYGTIVATTANFFQQTPDSPEHEHEHVDENEEPCAAEPLLGNHYNQ